ncbi:hypothetical protein HYH03_005808 [Edaphochlamys debaryana]|uniref:Uncharacterized protein n=1 Tax=Edaphochlamys debaryana TaxID=47281 RepID=A0A836C251_9CHLO|nr:hypothetical protein HYH03_005808 [Edaphochlamys debaryana]|eukprot:KAG2496209.1 hypothetical protein HYH03_005808 [Edaphochlamys debaryana]
MEMDEAMRLPLPLSSSNGDVRPDPSTSGRHGRRLNLLGRGSKGIVRFGLPSGGLYMYWNDIFHTLLNMPRYRFLCVFFAVYITEYLVFALLYLTQPKDCVGGVMRFSHAMWFSVYTAATLGYTGSVSPNPDCTSVNVLVIFQVITASLIDYCMMGLVFARFASPNKRSFTIRFSSHAVLFQRPEDGLWCLSFRLANIRKTSLISPQISLMLAVPYDSARAAAALSGAAASGGSGGGAPVGTHFRFQELDVEALSSQQANLRLGLHAHINHVIRPGSPLYDRSLDSLEAAAAEVLCFMEGVDPMTSNNIQARHSYTPADIRMNERFVPIELKLRRGELGLDFSEFDGTTAKALAAGGSDEVHREGGFVTYFMPVPGPGSAPNSGAGGGAGADGSRAFDVEGGWRGAGAAQGGGAAGGGAGVTMDVVAAALSGDMAVHMRALRGQSIRSLTTPMAAALPQLVPSVGANGFNGPNGFNGFAAAGVAGALRPGGGSHPLAGSGGSGSVGSMVMGMGPGAGVAGGGLELPFRDLLDAVLTDVGVSGGVKRQAAALKEALEAAEHVPRGPAELAGRQL